MPKTLFRADTRSSRRFRTEAMASEKRQLLLTTIRVFGTLDLQLHHNLLSFIFLSADYYLYVVKLQTSRDSPW